MYLGSAKLQKKYGTNLIWNIMTVNLNNHLKMNQYLHCC